MSSTTDRDDERGQVLVLFAFSLVVLLLVAALAFDVGQVLVERRDQQNAADAAALAGARYVLDAANGTTNCSSVSGPAPAATSGTATAWAVCNVAGRNGSGDDETVTLRVPPSRGDYKLLPGFVEVEIHSNRSGVFGGTIGRTAWPVGVRAVAGNQADLHYAFGMLALSPTECKAIHISGSGTVTSAGNVQSNSTGSGCSLAETGIGLSRTGGGVLNVTAPDAVCRSGGRIQDQGVGTMTCTPDPFSFPLPDPLRNLAAPIKPALAAAMKEVNRATGAVIPSPTQIPASCPGATGGNAPSETTAATCVLGQNNPTQRDRQWILSPGLYPGGLDLRRTIVYLLPGIYWIGGGGIRFANEASMISVNSETDRAKAVCTLGATPPCTGGGGVLIYNSFLPTRAAEGITLGSSGTTLSLQPYDYPFEAGTIELVLFQDRTVALAGDDITLNGANSQADDVRGIVYAPQGDVKVNGGNSIFNMDQVIANTFKVNGSGGTINVLHETGVDAKIVGVGLVE